MRLVRDGILVLTLALGGLAHAAEPSRLDRLCTRLEPGSPLGQGLFRLAETAIRANLGLWPRNAAPRAEAVRPADRELYAVGAKYEHGLWQAFDAQGNVLCSVPVTSAEARGCLARLAARRGISAGDLTVAVDKLIEGVQQDPGNVARIRYTHTHPRGPLAGARTRSSYSWADKRQSHSIRDYLAFHGIREVPIQMGLLYEIGGEIGNRVVDIPPKGAPIERPQPPL